jgi:hypothetical protein
VGYGTSLGTSTITSLGPGYGTAVNVPKVLSGRLPRDGQADEAAVNFTVAQAAHLTVGDNLALDLDGVFATKAPPSVRVVVRVVGIRAPWSRSLTRYSWR